jgi:hypothetical protein
VKDPERRNSGNKASGEVSFSADKYAGSCARDTETTRANTSRIAAPFARVCAVGSVY